MDIFQPQDPRFEDAVRESFGHLTLMRTIGARLCRVAAGEVDIDLPFREDLTQHHGFLAAATLTAIVDVACGYAAMTLMPVGATVLTVEYKANFMAPAQGERVIARARVVHAGRTIFTCAGDVFAAADDRQTLVATMLATMVRVGGERLAPPDSGAPPRDQHHARHRRRWCICGGRGFGGRLREIARVA